MEVAKGSCVICLSDRIINQRDAEDFIDMLLELIGKEQLDSDEVRAVRDAIKLCPVCCFKVSTFLATQKTIQIESEKKEKVHSSAVCCQLCSSTQNENRVMQLTSKWKYFIEIAKQMDFVLASQCESLVCIGCFAYMHTVHTIKHCLFQKFPQIRSSDKRTELRSKIVSPQKKEKNRKSQISTTANSSTKSNTAKKKEKRSSSTSRKRTSSKSHQTTPKRRHHKTVLNRRKSFKSWLPLCKMKRSFKIQEKHKRDDHLYRHILYVDLFTSNQYTDCVSNANDNTIDQDQQAHVVEKQPEITEAQQPAQEEEKTVESDETAVVPEPFSPVNNSAEGECDEFEIAKEVVNSTIASLEEDAAPEAEKDDSHDTSTATQDNNVVIDTNGTDDTVLPLTATAEEYTNGDTSGHLDSNMELPSTNHNHQSVDENKEENMAATTNDDENDDCSLTGKRKRDPESSLDSIGEDNKKKKRVSFFDSMLS